MVFIVCAFPGMGKTHFTQTIPNPFSALDLDFGHYRSHFFHDSRPFTELRNAKLRIADIDEIAPSLFTLLSIRHSNVLSYYTAKYRELVRQVSVLDVDVILTNAYEVVGCNPDAEYWVVIPSSISWWKGIMSARRHEMVSQGVPSAKLAKHDSFVAGINQAILNEWADAGKDHRVRRTYAADSHEAWQSALLAELRRRRYDNAE